MHKLLGVSEDFEIIFTGSEKSAICIVLSYYRSIGKFLNKNDELWVSPDLPVALSNIIHKICFPSISVTQNTKGVFLTPQYNFPTEIQNLKNKPWFFIELGGSGPIREVRIIDFTKHCPSIIGGAIVTKDLKLIEFVKKRIESQPTCYSLLSTCSFLMRWAASKKAFSFFKNTLSLCIGMMDAVDDVFLKIHPWAYRIIIKSLAKKV